MSKYFSRLLLASVFLISACSSSGGSQDATSDDTFVTTGSGLQYKVVTEGNGQSIQNGKIASVHYTGWLYDESAPDNRGTQFDSSRDSGQPISFPLGAGRVIEGWDEGIFGMKIGEQRVLIIPSSIGYGTRGSGPIPANATMIFDVELTDISDAQ